MIHCRTPGGGEEGLIDGEFRRNKRNNDAEVATEGFLGFFDQA
jgi:hypothetical protein